MIENIKIYKKHLKNGFTVLAVPMRHMPKVSPQLFYNVGSRHEQVGQKGLAHLLEHMAFKGTVKLSEADISAITTKLSGLCNAFTSQDCTGYSFEFPTQHWLVALDMFADCMHNCTFKPDLLDSELQAVVQELKMYRDDYETSIVDELMGAIFRGHPYHYPIVGYKNDLCLIDTQRLKSFYAQYYNPNNATLVIVGDIDYQQVFDHVQKYFGQLTAVPAVAQAPVYWERDFAAKSLTLYRDVQAPVVVAALVIPGLKSKKTYALDILNWIIGSGRGSRLYKKLVEQLNIAASVDSFYYDLFDYGLLLIQVQPKALQNIYEIIEQIKNELSDLREQGVRAAEFERARAKEQVSYLSLFEGDEKLAYAIGKSYLATNDEQYMLTYCDVSQDVVAEDIKVIIQEWVHPNLLNVGYVLPLAEKDKELWNLFQNQSDEFDQALLASKKRESTLEKPTYAAHVPVHEFPGFRFPHYTSITLSNGLDVLYYRDQRIPKVECILELKSNYLYDPEEKQGLSNFANQLLLKGTSKYPAAQLIDIFENKGIGVATASGGLAMNCLSRDLSFAFDVVAQILTDSVFAPESMEQVRHKINVDLAEYWDQPYSFVNDLIRKQIYGIHPYNKNLLGTPDSIKLITHDDLLDYYKKYVSPQGARLAIVGDFEESALKQILENTLGRWLGPRIDDLIYPGLSKPESRIIDYPINRDQVVLSFAGLSVARKDPEYDRLLLFDQEFGGSALGSMSSLLFKIREQSGLFYAIAGSVIAGVDKQPGLVLVKTIVSLDRLAEAERLIKQVIETAPEKINDHVLEQAKRALTNTMMDYFGSYRQTALTFLSLKKFDLPVNYFDIRAQQLQQVGVQSVKDAAKKILDINSLITVKVGRI